MKMAEKISKNYSPHQQYLLPPSLKDWLPDGHLTYFISDVVDELDLSEIYSDYCRSHTSKGQPPYEPSMMVKLLLYAYCVGIPSSRKIEKKTYEDLAFRMLTADQHPDHDTIAEFRKRHLKRLESLFTQVLLLCMKAGLVKLGHVALDSTKVKANASKHKAMSYGRMCEKEKELEQKVKELLEKAQRTDEEEDIKFGKGKKEEDLPEELRFHKNRLEKIREAKKAIEEEFREKKETEERAKDNNKNKDSVPDAKAQRNFTDPESRIMKDTSTKSFIQGYNCQAAVDAKAQIIVAADVVQDTVDKKQFEPMVEEVKENVGKYPDEVSADSGYYSEDNVKKAIEKGIDAYLSPEKIKHGGAVPVFCGRIPKRYTVKERMRRKLWTKRGRETYSKRKETVEPVFGQIKQARGFRQFLLRGIEKVRAEWRLICLAHNLLKVYRHSYLVALG